MPAFRPDGSLNVFVESPRGGSVKFKYDPAIDRIVLSRPLPAGLAYPHDWGFVPSTHAADGDPVDALIAWDGTSYPGVIIPSRTIGVLSVEQTNPRTRARERNDRLVVLPVKAPRHEDIATVFDLSERWRVEIERFFLASVAFEGKDLMILGWGGIAEADALVTASLAPSAREQADRAGDTNRHATHRG